MSNEKLVLLIQQGVNREENIEQLWIQNQGLISTIIMRYSGVDDPDDLRQQSFFGLLNAADAWRPDGGARFTTYAAVVIRQTIRRYLSSNGSGIRLPEYLHDRIGKYVTAVDELRQDLGREPTAAEVAAKLEISEEEVGRLCHDADLVKMRSLDEVIGEDVTRADGIADPRDYIEETIGRVHAEELAGTLWRMVDDLPDREAAVIRGRYQGDQGLKDLGDDLGISPERVRQIEAEGLKRLRRRKRQLEPFVEDIADRSISHTSYGTFKRTGESAPEWAVLELEWMAAKHKIDFF